MRSISYLDPEGVPTGASAPRILLIESTPKRLLRNLAKVFCSEISKYYKLFGVGSLEIDLALVQERERS